MSLATARRRTNPADRDTARDTDRDRDLLGRLGLSGAASPEAIETAHRNLIDYLAGAPRDLRAWARQQAADADAAYLLLLDPAASTDSDALGGPRRAAAQPGGPATPPARRATSRAVAPGRPTPVLDAGEIDEHDELDALIAEVDPGLHRDISGRSPARRTAAVVRRRPARRLARGVRRLAVVGLIALGAVGIAVVGYNVGAPAAPASDGTNGAGGTQQAGLDRAKVAALMTKIQADPTDTEALFALADEYFAASDFATAETWLTKLLAVEPTNARALVALGAAKFNGGDVEAAAARWTSAISLDPTNVEAHYDLGFLFYSGQPQDLAGVEREWGKVIELAPGTDLARTVQAHLDALASAAPSRAPGSSPASPAASAGPSATSSGPPDGAPRSSQP